MRGDGTGTVQAAISLDDEAVEATGDLADALEVDDLRQSGWKVVGPKEEGDGRTWVRASKPFSTPEQATQVLAELSGPRGPFRDLEVRQERSFFHTHTGLSGTADLSAGLAAYADPDLEQRLGGSLGFDLDALASRFGTSLPDAFRVEVVARLPGSIEANATEEVRDGVKWVLQPGQQLRLEAEAETFNLVPWLPALGTLLAVATALGVLLWRRRRTG